MFQSKNVKSAKKNIGFYIALGVCIATVAAAAWTTYGRVTEKGESPDMGVDHEVSGEPYELSAAHDASTQSDGTDGRESGAGNMMNSESKNNKDSNDSENSKDSKVGSDSKDSNVNEGTAQKAGQEQSGREEKDSSSEAAQQKEKAPEKSVICYPLKNAQPGKAFSMTKLVFSKTTNDWRTHRGADFVTNQGSAVLAIADGRVTGLYRDALYGETIVIEHDGYTARYCGLTDRSLVRQGDAVSAGSPIGYVGVVPCEQSDEPHLHLELLSGDKLIDPIVMLSGA